MASPDRQKVLYLMGPGRSGTTILAAILGAHADIAWHGELIHLGEWRRPDSVCTCGEPLRRCLFWKEHGLENDLGPAMELARPLENNRGLPHALLRPGRFPKRYKEGQERVCRSLADGRAWLLDSSKWVGRAIGLGQCDVLDTRYIYLVRDARGLVHSFGKSVQTPRSLPSACLYFWAANLAAELTRLTCLRGRCLKLRYEDLVANPEGTLSMVADFTGLSFDELARDVTQGRRFGVSHGAGGNRWAKRGPVQLQGDDDWRHVMKPWRRILVYLVCLPFQLLNRYEL